MFFFSAATYNGHRIHYDKDFARDVEGYDNVLVQGPLQAALLSRALTDWIGGDGRLVAFSVQNRAIAHPGQELTFGGVVTGKRMADDVGVRGSGHLLPTRRRRVDAGHRDRRAAAAGRRDDRPARGSGHHRHRGVAGRTHARAARRRSRWTSTRCWPSW